MGRSAHERNSLVYWVSWRSDARSERKAAPPRSSRVASRREARKRLDERQQRRDDPLAVGLADDAEADRGRDEVRDEAADEGLERPAERRCRGPPRRPRPRPDRRPARARRRVSSIDRRRTATRRDRARGRRRPASWSRGAARPSSRARARVPRPRRSACRRRRRGGAIGRGEQDRVVARRAVREKIGEPGFEARRVVDVAGLVRPFEPVRIGEGADREGRRQPDQKRQMRRHQWSCSWPWHRARGRDRGACRGSWCVVVPWPCVMVIVRARDASWPW